MCEWHVKYRRILWTSMICSILLAMYANGFLLWLCIGIAAYSFVLLCILGMGLILKECESCMREYARQMREEHNEGN